MRVTVAEVMAALRAMYEHPPGLGPRFDAYRELMEARLPLGLVNPMGKEHVVAALDALLTMDAEGIARDAAALAAARLDHLDDELTLVIVPGDPRGGWSNRWLGEFEHRLSDRNEGEGWSCAVLWAGDPLPPERVHAEVMAAVLRTVLRMRRAPLTLGDFLHQEGLAAAFGGVPEPALDAEELAYTRDVVRKHLDGRLAATMFACAYGDEAAFEVGYTPVGLSPRAGFAVALDQADRADLLPEQRIDEPAAAFWDI